MRRRIAGRHAALAAKGWVAPSGWRRTPARGAGVAGVTTALVASATASALTASTSLFAGENYGIALLNLPTASPASTGRGVTVAVVDSGLDATNPFLAPRLVPGHDFADGTRTESLMVGSRDCTKLFAGVTKQVDLVRAALERMSEIGEVPVRGMLCFVEDDRPLIGGSFTIGGVEVLWPKKAAEKITAEGPCTHDQALEVHRHLAGIFPPA